MKGQALPILRFISKEEKTVACIKFSNQLHARSSARGKIRPNLDGAEQLCVDSAECAFEGSQEPFYLLTRASAVH